MGAALAPMVDDLLSDAETAGRLDFIIQKALFAVRYGGVKPELTEKDLELVDGELPRSTKAEPGHGMGLVNVREVLDRCRCEYTLSCRDRWFRFTCAVPTRKL